MTWLSLRPARRPDRHSTLSASSAFRVEVRPPSLRHAPSSLWGRTLFWLTAPAPMDAAPPLNRLPPVRLAFLEALSDLDADATAALRARIEAARSLRDLWHLRADVYGLVGLFRSQSQAEQRVSRLDHHFPTRAPRSAPPTLA